MLLQQRLSPFDWKSFVRRYALTLGILALIVAVQTLLLFFSIKLSFTIPIIVGLVAAGWYGGRGPGIFLAFLIALISASSTPPAPGTTQSEWLFAQISNFALMIFIVFVISERKLLGSKAREAGERYEKLFQNNPFPMWIYDLETLRFLAVNEAATVVYGYSSDEFLKMTVKDIRPEEEIPALLDDLGKTDPQATQGPALWKHRRRDGAVIDVEITSDGLLYEGRSARRVLANDVTERLRAEKELRDSETQFRTLAETASDAIITIDESGSMSFANAGAARMFGYSEIEMIGQNVTMLMPEQKRGQHHDGFSRFLKTGQRNISWKSVELPGRHKNGSEIQLELSFAEYNKDGKRCFTSVIRDITERKKAEESLARSAAIIASSDDAIIGETLEGIINSWNPGAERIFGYSAAEAIGKNLLMLCPPERASEEGEILSKIARGEYVNNVETVRVCKDGTFVDVSVTLSPISDSNGKIIGASKIARDITESKRVKDELQRLNAELEQRVVERTIELQSVNRELESFSYSVSHDLRAPLRAMDGFSLALVEDYGGRLDDAGKNFLNRIRIASQQMSRLIDDLLSLSRVTRSEIRHAEVDLSSITKEIVERLGEVQPRKGSVFDVQDDIKVYGDERLLRIALENLLNNAWKFTSKTDKPQISFKRVSKNNGNSIYCVSDNGAGFDMKYADKLFGAFQRLHSTNEFDGTGIGLATVQRIINRHGGRIWAEGEVGKGAAFYFTI
ncbi:MAG TPA: PAS domain S-box protein [Pyrinomonadaceae bacterium]|nr:PAS domain S-box protein [Pyrinomonadaceae bacterium]